jgi:hypothetical protein
MLKSHTHAEISHREHSRYQLTDLFRDTIGINLQLLPRYARYQLPSRLYISDSTPVLVASVAPTISVRRQALRQRYKVGDRRLDVCSMKGEVPEVQDLVCMIPFVLLVASLGYHYQARSCMRNDYPLFLCLFCVSWVKNVTLCQAEPRLPTTL